MNATTLIATRASMDKKARFRALAASRGMDESKLLRLLIDRVLDRNPATQTPTESTAHGARVRVTIRLRSGDAARLAHRAASRGLKPATYLGALARAHLRGNPPLPMGELAEVKRAVAELSAIGRGLNGVPHTASGDDAISPNLAEDLQVVRAGVEQLRACVAELVKANLISWESDDG